MFHVHFSNRFETLAALLAERLAGPRADVFAADEVVVPGSAMRRALTLAIAERESVCANVRFSYLARWLWWQVARLVPGVAAESPFDPESLTWRVHAAFGDAAFVARHPRLASYLAAAGADDVMRYELAGRCAALLEQYVTYRPDWLMHWQEGARVVQLPARTDAAAFASDESWQAALWQRLAAEIGLGAQHPLQAMAQRLAAGGAPLARGAGLPQSVHVFGLPTLAPLHLQGLQALSRGMDVHIYAFNPCRQYWFDVVDAKALARLEAAGQGGAYEEGHRLLASWGKQAQASLGLVTGVCHDEGAQASEHYVENGGGTLLARLQDAILDLQELAPGCAAAMAADRSVEVHVCHSLTRELEVLHDHLLGLFSADPALQPGDVLVVTPDLERAAPLVEAVFGTVPAARRIPYTLTGRARSGVNAPVRAFLALLALAASRCPATTVFALLQQPVVARRFGLDTAALQQVRDWMLAAGMHWALDAEHVESFGLPPVAPHSLADGMERLFLGYALPEAVAEPFAGRLPCGGAEGSAATPLGALQRFLHELAALRRQLTRSRDASQWAAYLHGVADTFLAPAADELEDLLELHDTLDALADAVARGEQAGEIASAVLRTALLRAFDDPARGGVPSGRVTFAAISSLRHLPYKVVCAIGLADGAFPTADRPAEFDLMAQAPRTGDRQRGTDQRNLFLDLLLAARSSLYLSYTGRSIRDNAPLPPSVLVAELLDVLVPAIASDPDSPQALQAARAALVVEHPLQPFAAESFDVAGDTRLRSFDAELAQALRQSLAPTPSAPAASVDAGGAVPEDADAVEESESAYDPASPFFTLPLPEPEAAWREVSAAALIEFYRNPARYLLSRRLKLELPRDEDELQDDEPFLPQPLAVATMAHRLLPAMLQGASLDTVRALAAAGTELPAGAMGEAQREAELVRLQRFAQRVREATLDAALPPHHARVVLGEGDAPWVMEAGYAGLRPQGLVRFRYADEGARDVIEAGILHLLLCADPPPAGVPALTWYARNGRRVFAPRPAEEAREWLALLLHHYGRGLREPLPFAPKTAWAWVESGEYPARLAWLGGERGFGERNRPGYALAFRGRTDLLEHEAFDTLAHDVVAAMGGEWHPLAGDGA